MKQQARTPAKKKRGRPATGISRLVGVRVPDEEMAALEKWRRSQRDKPSVPVAIRRLTSRALRLEGFLARKRRKKVEKMRSTESENLAVVEVTEEIIGAVAGARSPGFYLIDDNHRAVDGPFLTREEAEEHRFDE